MGDTLLESTLFVTLFKHFPKSQLRVVYILAYLCGVYLCHEYVEKSEALWMDGMGGHVGEDGQDVRLVGEGEDGTAGTVIGLECNKLSSVLKNLSIYIAGYLRSLTSSWY